jgi:acyl carrier protein
MAGMAARPDRRASVGRGLIGAREMPDSLPDTVRRIMADILEIDVNSIDDDSEMGVVEQWDSGNHISLVLALEEEFGVSFEVSEIEAMTSFVDVVSTLEHKL